MSKQKILIMSTSRDSLRADAEGWTFEDASNIQPNEKEHPHIGIASINKNKICGEFYCFDCPVRAMANGWRLMAPSLEHKWVNGDGKQIIEYIWWFEKMVDEPARMGY